MALSIIFFYWWLWLPPALFIAFWELLVDYNQAKYISQFKWIILELQVPRDVHRSIKAMEQTFSGLHVIGSVGAPKKLREIFKAWREKNFKGKIADWISLEIVSIGGQIHFYIRCLESHRQIIQAQIYAHYPEAEISEVADYLSQLPIQAPNDEYEFGGQELGLTKEDAYPIRTFEEFEEAHPGKDDAKRVDPLGPVAEAMAALSLGEYLGIQILVRSADDAWVKKAQEVFDKIFEKPVKPREDALDKLMSGVENTVQSVVHGTTPEIKKDEKKAKAFNEISVGKQDVVKAIERSLAKFGFQTGIRIMYLARKDNFLKDRLGSVLAAFKLFSSPALNGFKAAFKPEVTKGFNRERKTVINKKYLYRRYRLRAFPEKPFILTTEELATVFHFPDVSVQTPTLPRIESKKGEPPVGLPIV
jgi:hypothetical protein